MGQVSELLQILDHQNMKDDLLILKLLKVPVTIIKYLSKFVAMLTYLPNYLIILILDAIIFSTTLSSSLFNYAISWPFRLAALVGVVIIFCAEFLGLYKLLSISHFHWGIQLVLTFIAFQGILALMRHGYLTMIKKYSPTKLKSPLEHLEQISFMLKDILGIILTIVNAVLLINITKTLKYNYSAKTSNNYLKHITKLIHVSILDLIKLFYIKIFFRLFPWRYLHSQQDVQKEEDNILQLVVLLTLLFWLTVLDLVFFVLFGLYCAFIHPRKRVYKRQISQSHQKFKVTAKFLLNTLIELFQIVVALICMPLKFNYSKQLLGLICAKENDYSFHYLGQTFFVLKLALVKLPSLFCELILLIFFYKYKKIGYLIKLRNEKQLTQPDGNKKQIKIFNSKFQQAGPVEEKNKTQKSYYREARLQEREYIVFRCFGSLVTQIIFLPLIPFCTVLKIWNILWLRYLVDEAHDLRVSFIVSYFVKICRDYFDFIPGVLTTIILGFYDPVKAKSILKKLFSERKQLKLRIPKLNKDCNPHNLHFYDSQSAILPLLMRDNFSQIKKDLLFLPLFIASRLSLLSLMGCAHPKDSVELFEYIWMLFYIKRVRRSAYFEEYLKLLKIDEAAGMIKNSRQRLRFWKFAHKSIRHRLISRLISLLLPKYRAQKAIANAKIQKNYSAIANHYWHCYNTNKQLLLYLVAFVIEMIITLFGVVILMPLTLWRMPTFIILFKIHKYKKKMFFKILFPMYLQMLKDLLQLFVNISTAILFPRAYFSFRFKTAFRYTEKGIEQFEHVQKLKFWYIAQKILVTGFRLYGLIWKVVFVKIFWVRKRDMNEQLTSENIKLSIYVKDFLLTPQSTPTLPQLINLYDSTCKLKINQGQNPKPINDAKISDINSRGEKIAKIVDSYVRQTFQDIPFLMLMVFLFWTLPWRFHYIKNALFMMRDDKIYRRQFIKILKLISKDYQCIALYIILIFSIVKTRRAFVLFYRNCKLNFYIGTLRYSHLKQLRGQLLEAAHFYKSVLILVLSCIFGPYRIGEIYRSVRSYYIKVRQQDQQREKNRKIYENTVKQGKSLELITSIGNNTLLQVFTFLDAKQLTVMTRVSKYMYDTIKERDQVWIQQWQRLYEAKYSAFKIVNQLGEPSYNSMCVQKFKQENANLIGDQKDKFYKLSIRQFQLSAFETELNLKDQLQKILPAPTFQRIFTSLSWAQHDGYGPEQFWPRPNDNQQFIALFNIQRRPIVDLQQDSAGFSWLFARPLEFFIIRLNRFYNNNTHRKKKQILYWIFNVTFPLILLGVVIFNWSWVWEINAFIGYKILGAAYFVAFFWIGFIRYRNQSRRWVTLTPFDIVDDIIYYFYLVTDWMREQSTRAANWTSDKVDKYIKRPIRWIGRKISHYSRLIGRKIAAVGRFFMEKVAKPLYMRITSIIIAIIQLIKDIYRAFVKTLTKIIRFFGKILRNIYNVLFEIVKSVSKFYATSLEQSLRLALRFGTLGELVFTIIVILGMVSPSIICYYYFFERWFIIFSTILSMVFMVTGYKHLNRMKERVLTEKNR